MKRLLDIFLAGLIIFLTFPIILITLLLVYLYDKSWPVYSPTRIGKNKIPFKMHKARTMVVGADKSKVDTTGLHDKRITPIGGILRRYKLDELPQIWNVLVGEMSFVGPRPQIDREVCLYTAEEEKLLNVRPGITDFSSIVFSDLAEIVANSNDPNIAYNQLIRPWKSRLGLFYIEKSSIFLDVALILLTVVSIVSRSMSLKGISILLKFLKAPQELIQVCKRETALTPTPPPGSTEIVVSRN